MPARLPCTSPVAEPTVATLKLELVQVPPGVGSVRLVTAPTHIPNRPVIASGDGVVHTVVVTKQPVDNVYVIVVQPTGIPGPAP